MGSKIKIKYQNRVAYSYICKLACDDDKLSKRFKSYLSEDTVFSFINITLKEIKYCNGVMKKTF